MICPVCQENCQEKRATFVKTGSSLALPRMVVQYSCRDCWQEAMHELDHTTKRAELWKDCDEPVHG